MHGYCADAPRPGDPHHDVYVLRDRIWCELCSALMVPVMLSTRIRYYGCPYRECPRPLIEAAVVEQLVWQQFALLYEGTTLLVPTRMRWETLRHKLKRVRVGEDASELWHEWTD